VNTSSRSAVVFAGTMLMAAILACGGSPTQKLREAIGTVTVETAATASPQSGTAAPAKLTPSAVVASQPTQPAKATATVASQPSQPPKPTATVPTPKLNVIVLASGLGQRGRSVGFGFVLENPNANYAIERSQYQVAIYDEAGTVLQTESGYIEVILPSQRLGIADDTSVPEGAKAARLEVQISAKNYVASEALPAFVVGQTDYVADNYYPQVTAVITNPYASEVTDPRIHVVAYNAAGKIVGGGFTYVNFIPARGRTGATVSVVTDGEPARVEVYATLSALSQLPAPTKPAAWKPTELVSQGYGQNGRSVGLGFLIRNPNPDFSIENLEFRATAFAIDGRVIGVEEGFVQVVLPGQQLGVGADMSVAAGASVGRLEVQLGAGKFTKSEPLPLFTAAKATYISDKYFPKVTGVIANPYTKDVKTVKASAVAYDASGSIIGGGYTYVDFIPANSISVTTAGIPAKVEIFAVLSALSILQ
jgi:hypothetical protein